MNRLRIILFLLPTSYFLLPTSSYAYSLFSGIGLGEPVEAYTALSRGMGGLYKFELPRELTFECSFLSEIIDENGKATNFDFTLPYIRYIIPLPKGIGIDIGLNEVLNLNFDIESQWEWDATALDSVQRRVKGKGSASMAKIGIGKKWRSGEVGSGNYKYITFEVGGFWVFGSAQEEWVTDFINLHDVYAYDTLNLNFSGRGGMAYISGKFNKFNLSAAYFSGANLTSKSDLPTRFKAAIWYTPIPKLNLGIGLINWRWKTPFKPMTRFSLGSEWTFPTVILRGGFYKGNWYYGDIKEMIGSLGLSIPLKSLLSIDLSFEFGRRWSPLLEERIYRTCITLQGKEIL
ncbi:hypothetical protein KAW65_03040 [candidate division WOR-3 bacterium]|nr:hypothetical protein [candidate division WOR-3 bacterium]